MYILEMGENSEKVRGGEMMVRKGLTNQKLEQEFEEKRRVYLE